LRIRRSISQLQQILHQAKRNTVIALSATNAVTATDDMHAGGAEEISAVPEPPPPAPAPRPADGGVAAPAAPVPAAPRAGDVAPPPGVVTPPVPAAAPAVVAMDAAAPPGLPEPLAGEIRKALAWFDSYQGWKLVFHDEIEFLQRGLERGRADEAETMRSIFLRTR